MPKNQYLKNVVTLEMDTEKCTDCGMCMKVCPHRVFAREHGKVRIVGKDSCIECGACALNCPFGALEVRKGTGCAAAILYGMLGDPDEGCCCSDSTGCC